MTFSHTIWVTLGAFAVLGVATSTIYCLMVAAGAVRFRRRAAAIAADDFLPPVSVLKAVHGDEPDLELNLASFFEQDYPEYEILFCARHDSDLGLAAARQVAARYSQIKARIDRKSTRLNSSHLG